MKWRRYLSASMCMMVVSAMAASAAGGEISLDKGIIFKAPEATDSQNHRLFENNNEVKGAEIYVHWGEIETEEGVYDWSVIDKWAEKYASMGKKIAITVPHAGFSINDTPAYVFNKYGVRRIAKGYWLNFDNGNKDYILNGEIVDGYARVNALKKAFRSSSADAVKTDPAKHPLISSNGYSVQWDYRMESDGTLSVRAYSLSDPSVSFSKNWALHAGEVGSCDFEFTPDTAHTDFVVEIGIQNGTAILDNINIVEMKSGFHVGTLTFPDYFNPEFYKRYAVFVQAMAERYKDDERISIVYAGGFGRWDELTLCGDTEPNEQEDQWLSYGYTDEKYINHIKECVDLYAECFHDKPLMMTIAGYQGTDFFKNQQLIDYAISAYAAEKGVILKYNGWQERCTEWNTPSNAVYHTMYRHRYDDTQLIFEQGAQVNNSMSEIIGHPISVMNKAIGYGADYFWIYNNDLLDAYFSRYNHYLNESAGGVLNTKIFSQMMKFNYFSSHTKEMYNHYNLTFQMFQNRDKKGYQSDYEQINGVWAAKTSAANPIIAMSIDDRICYFGMYTPILYLEYLDSGTDSFTLYTRQQGGKTELATIVKQNTMEWKTAAIDVRSAVDIFRGGSEDSFEELMVNDNGDGVEWIRSFEIDYVPADSFQTTVVSEKLPERDGQIALGKEAYSFEIDSPSQGNISTLSLPLFMGDSYELSRAAVTVDAYLDGTYQEITKKEDFMPESGVWFDIPLGQYARAEKYRVTLTAPRGTVYLGANGTEPAWRISTYKTQDSSPITRDDAGIFHIDYPFTSLTLSDTAEDQQLVKILPNGEQVMYSPTLIEGNTLYFEPQTAGQYFLTTYTGKQFTAGQMISKAVYSAPIRQLIGDNTGFLSEVEWRISDGFANVSEKKGFLTGSVSKCNAFIETAAELVIDPERQDYLHFVIKNETSSSLAKVFIRYEGEEEYEEENAVFIPILANDTQYREYSYNIGYDKLYNQEKRIAGFRIVPAYGNLNAGRISIGGLELRRGGNSISSYNEPLNMDDFQSGTHFTGIAGKKGFPLIPVLAICGTVLATVTAIISALFYQRRHRKQNPPVILE